MIKKADRRQLRLMRHKRLRKKIFGTPERPRLAVFKSEKHIYAQIIDDTTARTLVAASTVEKDIKERVKKTWNIEAAKEIGKVIAQRALEKGYKNVVFDRGGHKYHGRIKALADAAREAGLEF